LQQTDLPAARLRVSSLPLRDVKGEHFCTASPVRDAKGEHSQARALAARLCRHQG